MANSIIYARVDTPLEDMKVQKLSYSNKCDKTLLDLFLDYSDDRISANRIDASVFDDDDDEEEYTKLMSYGFRVHRDLMSKLASDLDDMCHIINANPENWMEELMKKYEYLAYWNPNDNLAQEIMLLSFWLEEHLKKCNPIYYVYFSPIEISLKKNEAKE